MASVRRDDDPIDNIERRVVVSFGWNGIVSGFARLDRFSFQNGAANPFRSVPSSATDTR